jgi:defect-in-organelle-trafficking protein DotD
MLKKSVFLAVGAVLLAGCAQMPPVSSGQTAQAQANSYRLHLALKHAADRISSSLATLSSINAAAHPKFKLTPPPVSGPLAMRMSLNWDGTVSQALQEISSVIGYRFVNAGPAPSQPLLVDVHRTDVSAFSLLQNIGAQLGTQANVVIDANTKTLRLEYTSTEAGS